MIRLKTKNIENNELARMIQRGFAETGAGLSELRKEFQEFRVETESRFNGLENRMDALEHTLAEVLKAMREDRRETMLELQNLRERVMRLEKKAGFSR